MNQHEQSVHDEIRPYECDICSKAFNKASALKKRKQSVHDKLKTT